MVVRSHQFQGVLGSSSVYRSDNQPQHALMAQAANKMGMVPSPVSVGLPAGEQNLNTPKTLPVKDLELRHQLRIYFAGGL